MAEIHVQLLNETRKLIKSGEERYICIALKWVVPSRNLPEAQLPIRQIRSQISADIDPKCKGIGATNGIEGWLLRRRSVDKKDMTEENLRAYRLRYIDHLIEVWRNR